MSTKRWASSRDAGPEPVSGSAAGVQPTPAAQAAAAPTAWTNPDGLTTSRLCHSCGERRPLIPPSQISVGTGAASGYSLLPDNGAHQPQEVDMIDLPEPGLYRTTKPLPGHEDAFPAGVLVYVGQPQNGGSKFVVRPGRNSLNRWYWGEPTTPLRSPSWAKTLKKLPSEGFYTLPKTINFEDGGRWLDHAIVQLGYNENGQGILFIAERRDESNQNALFFSDRGFGIDDELLEQQVWAPILHIRASKAQQ